MPSGQINNETFANNGAKCHETRLLKSVVRAEGGEASEAKQLLQVRHEQFIPHIIARKIHIACGVLHARVCMYASSPLSFPLFRWHALLQTAYINTVGRSGGLPSRSHVDYISLHGTKSQSCPRRRRVRKREGEREREKRAFSISRSGILKLLPCSETNSISFTAAANGRGRGGGG